MMGKGSIGVCVYVILIMNAGPLVLGISLHQKMPLVGDTSA